jgi:hypothetical protein
MAGKTDGMIVIGAPQGCGSAWRVLNSKWKMEVYSLSNKGMEVAEKNNFPLHKPI